MRLPTDSGPNSISEMQKVEDEIHQPGRVAGIRFAIEIGLARAERRHGLGDRRILVRPVEARAGQQLDGAAVEPRVHPVAVEFDFVQPVVAFRRGVDQLRELRRNPHRQTGRG